MKIIYIVSFLLGVSIWFNIQSYMDYVDRKVKVAYEEGYKRGESRGAWEESVRNKIENINRNLSQTPSK